MSTQRGRRSGALAPVLTRTGISDESTNLRKIIIFKIILVVLTLICGAILALAINLIKLKEARAFEFPLDRKEDMDLVDKPAEYCQFKHKSSSKCLMAISGTAITKPLSICTVESATYPGSTFQRFHYNSGNISNPPEIGDDQHQELDHCVMAVSYQQLNHAPRRTQITEYGQFFHKIDKEMCITIAEESQKLEMALCDMKTLILQQFTGFASRNPSRLETNPILPNKKKEMDKH